MKLKFWQRTWLAILALFLACLVSVCLTAYTAARRQSYDAQNGGSYPEHPTATAMTAQQAANHGAQLLRVLRPGETDGWDRLYTICERQDDTGTRHQLWQVIAVRLGQTDAQGNTLKPWAWFHIHLDAVTGALVRYDQSTSAPDDHPLTRQEQEAAMAALRQILEQALTTAGAGQTLEQLYINSDKVDSIHLTFWYAAFIDGRFYEVSCERDGSLVRLRQTEEY